MLGHIGYHIIAAGLNGYLATITNLKNPVNKWRCAAAPITVWFLVLPLILVAIYLYLGLCFFSHSPNFVRYNTIIATFICNSQAMMTVKRYGRGHGASILGKPSLHPATVDLKGRSYEYVLFRSPFHFSTSNLRVPFWLVHLLWTFNIVFQVVKTKFNQVLDGWCI